MNIDKNAMALFVRVVEQKSFSKAGQYEGVPVSTVSRRVSELEKSLGVRLLERSTRKLRMTDIGRDYFEICRRGMEELEAANLLVADRQSELSGRLRISVPINLTDAIVMPLLEAFQGRYPNVKVQCIVTDRHVDLFSDGVDLSIRVGELSDSSLVAQRIMTHRSVLVASPRYLASIPKLTHPSNVPTHVQVAFSRSQGPLKWTLLGGERPVVIAPEPRLLINDYEGVQRTVIKGGGLSEMPSVICGKALADGDLVEVLPEWRFPQVNISVVYPSERHLSRVVRAFRDACLENFERLLPGIDGRTG